MLTLSPRRRDDVRRTHPATIGTRFSYQNFAPRGIELKILALDLGLRTGWATNASCGAYDYGTLDLRGSRYEGGGMRFLRFKRHLAELTKGVELVVFEEVRAHGRAGTDVAHCYGGLLATLTAFCESRAEAIPYSTRACRWGRSRSTRRVRATRTRR